MSNTATTSKRHPFEPAPTAEPRPIVAGRATDRFVTCVIGDLLKRKVAGFLEDHDGTLLDVGEHYVVMRIGGETRQPWERKSRKAFPVVVSLVFSDPTDLPMWQQASARRSRVDVEIRPGKTFLKPETFERRAREVLNLLRGYFVAS